MKNRLILILCFVSLMSCGKYSSVSSQSDDNGNENVAIHIDDQVFSPGNFEASENGDEFQTQGAATDQIFVRTWHKGVLPIKFEDPTTLEQQKLFFAACAEWSRVAQIKCVPYDDQGDYLHVKKRGRGCHATVGLQRAFFMKDEMVLEETEPGDDGCWNKRTILHEIGHVLGLIHEHQRSDRDQYLIVHEDRMGDGGFDFARLLGRRNLTTYDFLSVMHYHKTKSARVKNDVTMEPRPGYEQYLDMMGRLDYLSDLDGEAMRQLYGAPPSGVPAPTPTPVPTPTPPPQTGTPKASPTPGGSSGGGKSALPQPTPKKKK